MRGRSFLVLRDVEAGVETHLTPGSGAVEGQALESPRRCAGVAKVWIVLKSKAGIVSGVAEEDTSAGAHRFKTSQSLADQRLSYARPLTRGPHRHRSEPVPVAGLSVDRDGRKSDMADDFAALCRHKRKGQRACLAQRLDDPGFGVIAERHALERRVGKGVDGGRVLGTLRSNLHFDEPVENLSVQPAARPLCSARPRWLLRRVSLDRDAQRVPTVSDMIPP